MGTSNRSPKDLEQVDMIEHVNKYANIGLSDDDAEFFENFSPENRKKMIRKID